MAPSTAASAADHTAPGVSLRIDRGSLRAVGARGLRLALGTSEACRASIAVRVGARSARRLRISSRTIGRTSVRLSAAGRRAVTVRVSARVARALRSTSRLRVVARAVAIDASGNRRGTRARGDAATLTAEPSPRTRPCSADRPLPPAPPSADYAPLTAM